MDTTALAVSASYLPREIAVAEDLAGDLIGSFEPGLVKIAGWKAQILVQFEDIAGGSEIVVFVHDTG